MFSFKKLLNKNHLNVLKQVKDPNNISQKRLFVMWGLVLFGYFLFIVNWFIIDQVAGNYTYNGSHIGWSTSFFFHNPGAVATQATNWTITLMRGIGSILAGVLIAKVGHRKAVITVLALMVLSFPFILVAYPFNGGNALVLNGTITEITSGGGLVNGIDGQPAATSLTTLGYSLFVIFRMLLAIGGTTMITYTQPIIARSYSIRTKTNLSNINIFGFNSGIVISSILFVFSKSFNTQLTTDWYVVISILICLIFLVMVVYIFIGDEVVPAFERDPSQKVLNAEFSMRRIIKNKNVWILSMIYIAWLIAVVEIETGTARNLIEQSPGNAQVLADMNLQEGTKYASIAASDYFYVFNVFKIMFVVGLIAGFIFLNPFNKTVYERKRFMNLCFLAGISFMAISFGVGYSGYNSATITIMFIFIFLSGMCLWGVQSTILLVPHELETSHPKKVGTMFGLIWGIGYVGYTFGDIFVSLVSQAGSLSDGDIDKNSLLVNGVNGTSVVKTSEYGDHIAAIVIFFALCCLVFIGIYFLPKSGMKVNGVWQPLTKKWNYWNFNFKKPELLKPANS